MYRAVFRVVAVSVCCALLTVYTGYVMLTKQINHLQTAVMTSTQIQTESLTEDTVSTENTVSSEAEKVSSVASSVSTEKTQETSAASVPAKSAKAVTGKVIQQFLSPYTANLSYGKVYCKNSTDLKVDLKALLQEKLPYKIAENGQPQVLILHTHATESFLHETRDYYTASDTPRTQDEKYNMIRLGDIVAEKLNAAGICTLHDKTLHDYPSYNESYTRAAKTIKNYLSRYKSIQVVLDLHRDSISAGGKDKVKPVVQIGGKPAAQIMLVMGSQSGTVKNFPHWRENLKLAVRLQQNTETMYPTLARSISLMPRLYNENLTKGSLLIEIGTEANSIQEVEYAAQLLGNSLTKTLKEAE